ncbi:hypothetical protein [Nocardia fluminea]|uniref:hypothetical protein n=1 Tax=Nocardia fluminea TaxID=134984 RepID=UPI00365F06CD
MLGFRRSTAGISAVPPGAAEKELGEYRIDRAAVDAHKIGALPPGPTIADAHKCQWDARVRVSLELVSTSTSTKGKDLEIVTADGVQMYLGKGGSKAICTRAFLMPDAGEETIEVSVHGADGFRDEYCAIASSLLRQAVGNLPER